MPSELTARFSQALQTTTIPVLSRFDYARDYRAAHKEYSARVTMKTLLLLNFTERRAERLIATYPGNAGQRLRAMVRAGWIKEDVSHDV